MNEVNRITLCRDRYSSQEEFESAIKRAVMVLLENDYIMTVRWDEKGLGILCIDYEYDDQSMGASYPMWLSCEEQDMVYFAREENKNG